MYPLVTVPSNMNQLVVVLFSVENKLSFHVFWKRSFFSVLSNNFFNFFSIFFYIGHSRITSFSGS